MVFPNRLDGIISDEEGVPPQDISNFAKNQKSQLCIVWGKAAVRLQADVATTCIWTSQSHVRISESYVIFMPFMHICHRCHRHHPCRNFVIFHMATFKSWLFLCETKTYHTYIHLCQKCYHTTLHVINTCAARICGTRNVCRSDHGCAISHQLAKVHRLHIYETMQCNAILGDTNYQLEKKSQYWIH